MCHFALISPYSNGAVQIRVGLELAEGLPAASGPECQKSFANRKVLSGPMRCFRCLILLYTFSLGLTQKGAMPLCWHFQSHRHIRAIPYPATDRAIHVRCPIKTSTKELGNTIGLLQALRDMKSIVSELLRTSAKITTETSL